VVELVGLESAHGLELGQGRVAPWWGENSKEAYSSGLANLATALTNWSDSKNGSRRVARDPERGRTAAPDLGARTITMDVTDQASADAAAKLVGQDYGRLGILVNNRRHAGGWCADE
jgi:NAD(P)-dependent dehydrogenase (short-subunit alcohol dehydrogenase family)